MPNYFNRPGGASCMIRLLVIAVLAAGLLPVQPALAQSVDTDPTLGVGLSSFTPYHYTDSQGRTVIVGEVENTKDFPVTSVKIWAGFFGDTSLAPLESTIGTTVLDVIPARGSSPYMIISPSANPDTSNVSVNLLGFTSAASKPAELEIGGELTGTAERIEYSGTIKNNAKSPAEETSIHMVMYDGFRPPRLLKVVTVDIPSVIPAGGSSTFSLSEAYHRSTVGFYMFAESTTLLSNTWDVEVTQPEPISKKVSINDVHISVGGERVSSTKVGEPLLIQSSTWLQVASQGETYDQDYVYYAQVKQSGRDAVVEYVGAFSGSFNSPEPQMPSVEWIPEKDGLYFIETYMWDTNGVPLSPKGPVVLVIVN
ncbi:hypothetical protein CENSYa_0084 [Cenarchaeum symbiosum A]|uniref:Uncharacterized protein n=1 Tax=Cenarchaeum symbiosum (strain A) TaxID=414004 RepID=A0RTR2_CENSY|nr:hypothetical protein CENSYa_0084 [Cenarchaeum symbiosum A]